MKKDRTKDINLGKTGCKLKTELAFLYLQLANTYPQPANTYSQAQF